MKILEINVNTKLEEKNENLIYIETLKEYIIPSEIQKNELLKKLMKLWDIQAILD